MTIPKIIHQIAPSDKSRWHPLWFKCQESWLKHFPDFEYKLWNDEEDIDNLVNQSFPEYANFYNKLPVHIMKIDFSRFCMLYKYGGIYADMDMFVYKNFFSEIKKSILLLEAPYGDVFLENALMSSTKEHNFFIECIKKSIFRYNNWVKTKFNASFQCSEKDQKIIIAACGPHLVCSVFKNYDKTDVGTFSGLLYNNHGLSYHPSFFTKHVMTGLWGKETINSFKNNTESSFKDDASNLFLKEMSKFVNHNLRSLDDFDFYTDYTNGGFLTEINLDYDKNDIDNDPLLNNFIYQ